MRHQHERRRTPRPLREYEIDDRGAGLRIEIAGRLVGDEDDRIGGERAGERHALLLAAGHLRRVMRKAMREADGLELTAGALESVGAAGELQRNSDILQRRHRGDELERLEDDPYLPSAEPRQGVFVEAREIAPVDEHLAGIGPLEAGQRHQQRGFAGARRPDEADRLAARYGKAYLLEHMDARRARAEGEIDILEFDDRPLHVRRGPDMVCRCAARRPAFRDPARTPAPTYAKAPVVSSLRPRFRPLGSIALLCAAALLLLAMASARPASAEPLKIIAFGDSLSAGFQLPADAAFPAQLEARLKNDGYDASVVNASVSGDTTRGGVSRLSYALRDGGDLMILELGANDMLLGFDPATTRENLEKIVFAAKERGLDVLLAGMLASANFGEEQKKAFDAIFPELAARRGLPLYPFFLAGVVGEKGMTLPDGLHPSRAGVARIVEGVAPLVEKSLDSQRSRRSGAAQR